MSLQDKDIYKYLYEHGEFPQGEPTWSGWWHEYTKLWDELSAAREAAQLWEDAYRTADERAKEWEKSHTDAQAAAGEWERQYRQALKVKDFSPQNKLEINKWD